MRLQCLKCQKIRAAEEFGQDRSTSSGYNRWCKECINERATHRPTNEEIRARVLDEQRKERDRRRRASWALGQRREGKTLREIAEALGLKSAERARQIIHDAEKWEGRIEAL